MQLTLPKPQLCSYYYPQDYILYAGWCIHRLQCLALVSLPLKTKHFVKLLKPEMNTEQARTLTATSTILLVRPLPALVNGCSGLSCPTSLPALVLLQMCMPFSLSTWHPLLGCGPTLISSSFIFFMRESSFSLCQDSSHLSALFWHCSNHSISMFRPCAFDSKDTQAFCKSADDFGESDNFVPSSDDRQCFDWNEWRERPQNKEQEGGSVFYFIGTNGKCECKSRSRKGAVFFTKIQDCSEENRYHLLPK